MRRYMEPLTKLAKSHGAIAAIALFLIWWVTHSVSATQDRMDRTLTAHALEQRFYSRQICLNTSPTDAARAACQSLDRGE